MRPLALRPSNTAVGREGNRPGRPSIFNPGLGAGVSSVDCCVRLAVYSGLSAELTLTDGGKANRHKKRLYSRRLVRALLCEMAKPPLPAVQPQRSPSAAAQTGTRCRGCRRWKSSCGQEDPSRVYIYVYIKIYNITRPSPMEHLLDGDLDHLLSHLLRRRRRRRRALAGPDPLLLHHLLDAVHLPIAGRGQPLRAGARARTHTHPHTHTHALSHTQLTGTSTTFSTVCGTGRSTTCRAKAAKWTYVNKREREGGPRALHHLPGEARQLPRAAKGMYVTTHRAKDGRVFMGICGWVLKGGREGGREREGWVSV